MQVLKNVKLSQKTSFKVGGFAKNFIILEKLQDLENIKRFIGEKNFILAGGTNTLVSDDGFSGVIFQPNFNFIESISENSFKVGAGVNFSYLVNFVNNLGWSGLENAYGLPGSVGGALRGNAGCFGFEIKNVVKSVTAFNLLKNEMKIFSNQECCFDYRDSFFKKNPEWLIVEAVFEFKEREDKQNLWKISLERINYRYKKQPLEYPNAGSIFKNISFEKAPPEVQNLALSENKVKNDPFKIIPTAFLIAKAALAGKRIGNAQISEKHPNFIINLGHAKFKDIFNLIEIVQKTLEDKFQISPELEIVVLTND